MAYEGYVKYADDTAVSLQCFEGRHSECPDIINHVEDGPVTTGALDGGYYCECSCPDPDDIDCGLSDETAVTAIQESRNEG